METTQTEAVTTFYIWWLSKDVMTVLGNDPNWLDYLDVPHYVRQQYTHLRRSPAQGRLWIADTIPDIIVSRLSIPPACNGIVFHAEDLVAMKTLPGFITDIAYTAPDSLEISETTRFLEGVTAVVRATTFEQNVLFSQNKQSSNPMTWVQNYGGICEDVGRIDDKQVNVSLSTAVVDGRKVLFYTVVSAVSDYNMVYCWLHDNLPKSARRPDGYLNYMDPQNFHCVFSPQSR